jgi:hypothetical protein
MNESPFLESTQTVPQARVKTQFLVKHCRDYSLSAMAIVFGIGTVLAGLLITVVALTIHSIIPSPFLGYAGAALWFAFSVWLWVSLVLIGSNNRQTRVSDAELLALQALFFLNVFGHWLVASPQDKAIYHEISLVFEWCVIAFHFLYFLLALCVWVRLPLRSYFTFAAMLTLALLQTMQ